MGNNKDLLQIDFKNRTLNSPGDSAPSMYNSTNGGGGDMNNKDFVTHKEFNNAMHNIGKHFDHIDTKFAEQTLGLYKAMVSVGLGVIAILGFLITLVTFLK